MIALLEAVEYVPDSAVLLSGVGGAVEVDDCEIHAVYVPAPLPSVNFTVIVGLLA